MALMPGSLRRVVVAAVIYVITRSSIAGTVINIELKGVVCSHALVPDFSYMGVFPWATARSAGFMYGGRGNSPV